MSCDGNQCVSLYFFENGDTTMPERIRKRRGEIDRVVIRKGKIFFYRGMAIYALNGQPVSSFDGNSLPQVAAFVLVQESKDFIPRDYLKAFQQYMARKKARQPSKSMPQMVGGSDCPCPNPCAIPEPSIKEPSSCFRSVAPETSCIISSDPSEVDESFVQPTCGKPKMVCPQRSSFQKYRVNSYCNRRQDAAAPEQPCPPGCQRVNERSRSQRIDQTMCQLEGVGIECPKMTPINFRCKSRRSPTPTLVTRNTGFMATCCPCCVKKYKCVPIKARPVTDGCAPNAKNTQTNEKDFACAKRIMKQAIKEEKERQSHFVKKKKVCKPRRDICLPSEDEECDEKSTMNRERARQRYCERRRKMEERLSKALQKQYSKKIKCDAEKEKCGGK